MSRQLLSSDIPIGFLQDLPHHLIETFHSTLESALNCDLALIVCDATGKYDMQLQTTLQTLRDMHFSSPYLVIMNKSESLSDLSVLPYGSIAISAKENIGTSALKQQILHQFHEDFFFCKLFIPYAKMHEYNENKAFLTERDVRFSDDGKIADVVIPARYVEKFSPFIIERNTI